MIEDANIFVREQEAPAPAEDVDVKRKHAREMQNNLDYPSTRMAEVLATNLNDEVGDATATAAKAHPLAAETSVSFEPAVLAAAAEPGEVVTPPIRVSVTDGYGLQSWLSAEDEAERVDVVVRNP